MQSPPLFTFTFHFQKGPYPIQLVVPIAVRNAVSAATITFTASSMILCFFMVRFFFFEERGRRRSAEGRLLPEGRKNEEGERKEE